MLTINKLALLDLRLKLYMTIHFIEVIMAESL